MASRYRYVDLTGGWLVTHTALVTHESRDTACAWISEGDFEAACALARVKAFEGVNSITAVNLELCARGKWYHAMIDAPPLDLEIERKGELWRPAED